MPVVYRLDMKNLTSLFVAQDFPMSNKELMYVSTGSATQIQKFLNLLFTGLYPVLSAKQTFGF